MAATQSLVSADCPSDDRHAPAADGRFGVIRWYSAIYKRLVNSSTTPGFLVSLILHTALLLLLAIWTVAGPGRGGTDVGIVAAFAPEPDAKEFIADLSTLASGDTVEFPGDSAAPATDLDHPSPTSATHSGGDHLRDLVLAHGPGAGFSSSDTRLLKAESPNEIGAIFKAMSSGTSAALSPTSIEGRKPESRQSLASQRGGNADSEAAVELALQWLAAHQRPNGSWSLVHTNEHCNGQCSHPGSPERYEPAATGLALLAFLGAGYTHRDGKYAAEIKRGIYYLTQTMELTPHGGSFMFSHHQGMYNQGVATFALCEALQLSKDDSLRDHCQKAVNFIAFAQNETGGWGYLPKAPGDLTITGWQTMALKSADGAHLYIPAHTIVRIDKFLDSQTDAEKILYGYSRPSTPDSRNPTCTAIGLLLRLFRGWPTSDPRILTGVNHLEKQGISGHDIYRNYYTTLLLFHVDARIFQNWNPNMRDSLVRSQMRSGHAAGSWHFEDKFGDVGGRLYTTAMAAMTLEVYYRFSPIYLNAEQPFEY